MGELSWVKPVQFPGALGLDIPFSPLYIAQIREEHAYCGSQSTLCLFDPYRLELFLASCAKGSNRSNFPWIWLPRWPRWEIASYLYGACKHFSEFLKLASRQWFRVPGSGISSSVSFSIIKKSFSFSGDFRHKEYWECHAKIPRSHLWHAMWACASLGGRRSWKFAKRAAKNGCGFSTANETLRVPASEGRAICRCAGAAQLACRARSLAAAG